MHEYLTEFRGQLADKYDWRDILTTEVPVGPDELKEYLTQARDHLISVEGPNIATRRKVAPQWLGWWIGFLENRDPGGPTGKIARIENVHGQLESGKTSGVLFAAGLEGTAGHRMAVNMMLNRVGTAVLALEQPDYLIIKERQKPFLDLAARMSMWVYRSGRIMVTIVPQRNVAMTESEHYQNLFKLIGADYSFATKDDPHLLEKITRGKLAEFLAIPHYHSLSTTDSTRKLLSDIKDDIDVSRTEL